MALNAIAAVKMAAATQTFGVPHTTAIRYIMSGGISSVS
jgi:hypothetical protein